MATNYDNISQDLVWEVCRTSLSHFPPLSLERMAYGKRDLKKSTIWQKEIHTQRRSNGIGLEIIWIISS